MIRRLKSDVLDELPKKRRMITPIIADMSPDLVQGMAELKGLERSIRRGVFRSIVYG